jgi:4'-phosphopantetheinyl transferase
MPEPVEIWMVPLDPPERELLRLHGLLSPGERERAGEPPFAPRKGRYVARQGAVREILARYTGVSPARLELVRSGLGKPMVAGTAVHFSVSDSDDLALVAIARREVGVDVEQIRERPAARRAAPLGTRAFFERWTRIEATGKALGTGLARRRPGDRGLAFASLDVGRGFAAAVAVEADGVDVRLRTY